MRNQTPLAPREPALDVTVHIVLNDFGPLGRAYCETDEAEADEKTAAANIHPRFRWSLSTLLKAGHEMSPRTSRGQC